MMKKIRYIILLMLSIGVFTSCELDNFDGPDAGLYGSVIDEQTGQLVEQDIIRGGEIEIYEQAYENATPQRLIYKVDGTYKNSKLFSGLYKIIPIRTNFRTLDTIVLDIQGQTKLDLIVTPYIRIKDYSIEKNGTIVTAKFKLEQTGVSNVSKIGLYAGADKHVGEPMRLVKAEQDINNIVDPSQEYEISIDTSAEIDLKEGKTYFFRIGALYDTANARFNYAPAVEIAL
ncbi:DUF3823 domain-containing protein [Tamlana fucoidanivorans]|uniref:DUF3823 domain-containing protein n=1 Tax=Allotamlana fucoidanivorans TaxID=2583814 RepID=A0A5C4SME7_9FLAO|nr:DUF3823 domain-containing protein [Tamlana fucoidanivorans]TNJ44918.1 DUF3823 domain-containing protein [Tamlana fucoidanivorans]